jgi:hypothetical protein
VANSKISALTSATTPLAGTEVLPVVQSGATKQVSVANLTAGRTQTSNGIVQGTAATGYNFTANTPASGMTSQLLNWYEEGTWTPSLTWNGGTTGLTYSARSGYYTRVGRSVTLTFYIALSNKGSSTGAAIIQGAPFTCLNNQGARSGVSFGYIASVTVNQPMGMMDVGTTQISLRNPNGADLTQANFNNDAVLYGSIIYFV